MLTRIDVACYDFRGHPVRRLTFRDELAFVAREVGAALGYEEAGKRFASKVTGDWSNELKEGVHWHRVKGEELRRLKAALRLGAGPVPTRLGAEPVPTGAPRAGLGAEPVPSGAPRAGLGAEPVPSGARRSRLVADPVPSGPRAGLGAEPVPSGASRAGLGADPVPSDALARVPEVILLTEQGLNLALMRSGQPIAAEFRQWLARDVVPQIARTGRYDPAPAPFRLPRPPPAIAALRRVVDHAILSGRLDVAAELLVAYQKLAAAPGAPLLPPPARLRASNLLLTRLIQRRVLKGGPRLAVLFQQPAWRPSEKAMLGLLLELGAAERRVELSYVDAAERIDIHRSTAIGALRVLKTAGVVVGGGGRGGRDPEPNVYTVDLEALAEWNDKERPQTWGSPT